MPQQKKTAKRAGGHHRKRAKDMPERLLDRGMGSTITLTGHTYNPMNPKTDKKGKKSGTTKATGKEKKAPQKKT